MDILLTGDNMLRFLIRYAGIFGCTMAFRSSLRHLFLPLPDPWPHDTWAAIVLSAVGPSAKTKPVVNYRQHSTQFVGATVESFRTRLKRLRAEDLEQNHLQMEHTRNAMLAALKHPELHVLLLKELEQRMIFMQSRLEMKQGGLKKLPTWFYLLRRNDYAYHG